MKSLIIMFILFLAGAAWAVNNETINPFPTNSSPTSFPQLQVFARDETANILAKRFHYGFIVSGGIHGTSGSCISNSFSLEAFTNTQERVTANGAGGPANINYNNVGCNCQNPGSDHAWIIASTSSGNTIGNYRRAVNSNFFVNCSDTEQPVTPTDAVALFDTIITNGQITGVANGSFVQGIIKATPDGQTAEIPPGIWTAGPSGLLIKDRNDFTLTCTDNGTVIKSASNVVQAFSGVINASLMVDNCNNCQIANCTFDGNGVAPISLGVKNSNLIRIMNNKFIKNGGPASLMVHFNNYGIYKNNFFANPQGGLNGFIVGNVDGLTEFNCIVDSNMVIGMPDSGITGTFNGCSIINNRLTSNLGSGLVARFSEDSNITNNDASRNGLHGISVIAYTTARSNRLTISNNEVRQNGNSGIAVVTAANINLLGNTAIDNFAYGIYVDDTVRINISNGIYGNSDEDGFFTQNTGVFLNASVGEIRDVSVTNNLFQRNTLYGLRAANTLPGIINTLNVVGNRCRDNGQYGIILAQTGSTGLDGLMMTANQSYGHSIKDIRVGPSPLPIIKYTVGNLFITSEGF